MQLPTSEQVSAAMRHVGTATATATAMMALLGVLNQDQVQAVVVDVHQITDGLQQVFGGASKLVVLLGPIAALYFGKVAFASASLRSQLKSITTNRKVEIQGQ